MVAACVLDPTSVSDGLGKLGHCPGTGDGSLHHSISIDYYSLRKSGSMPRPEAFTDWVPRSVMLVRNGGEAMAG